MEVTNDALRYAHQRVAAFAQVNLGRPQEEKEESVPLLWQAVGITPASLDELYLIMDDKFIPDRDQGGFLLGVLYGLFVREFDAT